MRPPIPANTSERIRYHERLRVPLWMWGVGLGLTAILAAEVHLGYPGARAWVPYVVLPTLGVIALWWLGRQRIVVTDQRIYVDDAVLPIDVVTNAVALSGEQLRRELGTNLDRLAFVVSRPWIRHAVRLDIDDPNDPTPYWIVSVRRPAALVTIIAARQPKSYSAAPVG